MQLVLCIFKQTCQSRYSKGKLSFVPFPKFILAITARLAASDLLARGSDREERKCLCVWFYLDSVASYSTNIKLSMPYTGTVNICDSGPCSSKKTVQAEC